MSAAQNLVKCVRRCGLEVVDLVLQPLASSFCHPCPKTKKISECAWLTSEAAPPIWLFSLRARFVTTAVIPIAGDQITNDIAMALRTPTAEAEGIKLDYGVAMQRLVDPSEAIDVPSVGDRAPRRLSRAKVLLR